MVLLPDSEYDKMERVWIHQPGPLLREGEGPVSHALEPPSFFLNHEASAAIRAIPIAGFSCLNPPRHRQWTPFHFSGVRAPGPGLRVLSPSLYRGGGRTVEEKRGRAPVGVV